MAPVNPRAKTLAGNADGSALETPPSPRRRAARSKPTIKAVAERAGVAISTVSRVVNGGAASKLARERVLEAIQELGYSPSVAAQSLVSRRSGSIGLAVSTSQSQWFNEILGGVEQSLAMSRKSVLLASLTRSGKYDPAAVTAWIAEGRIDGLILVRYSRRDERLLRAANTAELPTVFIAPDLTAPVEFTVRCNNLEAGKLVGEHLVALHHERIAFAGGPEDSLDTRDRLSGLSEALAAAGRAGPCDIWFGPSYSVEAGTTYAREFLQLDKGLRPTAVVLGNDPMAIGFMRTVLQAGETIPGDVSVVGFDGTLDGETFWPGLTTIKQPTRRMAARACDALLEAIEGQNTERGASLEYGVELIVRESTGPRQPSDA